MFKTIALMLASMLLAAAPLIGADDAFAQAQRPAKVKKAKPACSVYCAGKYGHSPKEYNLCMGSMGRCDHSR